MYIVRCEWFIRMTVYSSHTAIDNINALSCLFYFFVFLPSFYFTIASNVYVVRYTVAFCVCTFRIFSYLFVCCSPFRTRFPLNCMRCTTLAQEVYDFVSTQQREKKINFSTRNGNGICVEVHCIAHHKHNSMEKALKNSSSLRIWYKVGRYDWICNVYAAALQIQIENPSPSQAISGKLFMLQLKI